MPSTRPVLLVVDDEPGIIAMIERFAKGRGFDVIARAGGRRLLDELPSLNANVALIDLRMPEVDGLELLKALRAGDPMCQVILMTAFATVDSAIEAVKLGALDYLSKPIDFARLTDLLTTVTSGLERRRALLEADGAMATRFEFCGMIGRSPVMQELFDTIRRLAPHVRTALITGETGTGKELVARALHKMGPRKHRRFVSFNCSAVVETLFESELFGHTRGAFTGARDAKAGLFEVADGGTLFLDEIGELSPAMQAKLLRVVEYGEVQRVGASEPKRVDVAIVAATNRGLAEEIGQGRFRQDLYYRLNVVEIALPPLRDRREDVPLLAAAFIRTFAKQFNKPISGMSPGAERLLATAAWPGNVRELQNTLERASILTDSSILTELELRGAVSRMAALGGAMPASGNGAAEAPAAPQKAPPIPIEVLDRSAVQRALDEAGGNKSAAARLLGVSRRAFYRRLDSFGLR